MGMRNLFLSVLRLTLCVAACYAFAADFKVSAWRGETPSVLVPDYTELGESPAGLDVRCGVLRTVRYRPVLSELQVAECYDIVDWSTSSGGTPRIAEIKVPRTAKPGLYKWGLMDIEVVDRELPYADREIFLVLDATTGQNAVSQAREFMQVAELTGIVLTKLDGTARGGVVLAIKNELKLPIKFIGVGEQLDDLQPFDQKVFAKALFENTAETHADED